MDKALMNKERIEGLADRWLFNSYKHLERVKKLVNRWVPNYNPWHDELGRFTFAGHGRAVWPKNQIGFSPKAVITKVGEKDYRINYDKLPPYRPDKAAVSVSNAYQSGLSNDINKGLREVRNARSQQEVMKAYNVLVKVPQGIARVPGESGNYYYTSTLVRNMSRTVAFKNNEEMTLFQGVAGDQYNKRAQKGSVLQLNNFASTSTSATVATDYAMRRGQQNNKNVNTVFTIKCPPGTAMAIPTYTKISGGLPSNKGMSDESEVVLAPSTTFRITKVGNIKNVKAPDGSVKKIREVQLIVTPHSKAADELSAGDYSRYEDKD